ncbi:hypothetical protein H4R33_005423 [Dimargaris cristalligena]|nr:hypothetical protein H4R33_005423 [Dimargaris cristalligena]
MTDSPTPKNTTEAQRSYTADLRPDQLPAGRLRAQEGEGGGPRRQRHPASYGPGPVPGRCNRYLDDFLHAITQFDGANLAGVAKVYWSCLRSDPGKEPPRYVYPEGHRRANPSPSLGSKPASPTRPE